MGMQSALLIVEYIPIPRLRLPPPPNNATRQTEKNLIDVASPRIGGEVESI
jgi:hypothetical protein